MLEQSKQTFLEKLSLIYSGQFKVEKTNNMLNNDIAVFPAKNKRFGNIMISGELHQWKDETDYDDIKFDTDNYLEGGGDFQDYCEDISLVLTTQAGFYVLTPIEIFEYLEQIFNDKMLLYRTWKPWQKRNNSLYTRADFEEMLSRGKIQVPKQYKLCFWSGNYHLQEKEGELNG